jgi:hypothetical protein
MRYTEIMVAWDPGTDRITVGPWPDRTGWSDRYRYTGAACFADVHRLGPKALAIRVLSDFHAIVVRDRVSVEAAHRAFLVIDEYRAHLAPDVPGLGDFDRD